MPESGQTQTAQHQQRVIIVVKLLDHTGIDVPMDSVLLISVLCEVDVGSFTLALVVCQLVLTCRPVLAGVRRTLINLVTTCFTFIS